MQGFPLSSTVAEFSKDHSTVLSSQLLQDKRNIVRPVNFISIGPLPQLLCYALFSLIRSTVVWNTMMVDKAFCMFTDGNFDRSIVYREGKYETKVSVYSNQKILPLSKQKWSM